MWERVLNSLCGSLWFICGSLWLIVVCGSRSLLDFGHFFLIPLSWLWNHVQRQQQKTKVIFGGSLHGRMGWGGGGGGRERGGSVGASSFGWFMGGFGWFLLVEGDFRWLSVLLVTPISLHTEELTLYCTHERTWLTDAIWFFYSK